MSEQELVYSQCREARAEGREIDHGTARTIAAWYRDTTAGEEFVSTGYVPPNQGSTLWREFGDTYATQSLPDKMALDMLGTYLVRRAIDGPAHVIGWASKWADR